jgi:hypothetical protein
VSEPQYAQGGWIPGGPVPVPMRLDPDECVINRHGECIRPDHPTATSDGSKPGAFWRCAGGPRP